MQIININVMYFRRIIIFAFLLCSLHTGVVAQDFDPPLRLEFDMAENKSMNLGLLGKNGLVVFFQKDAKDDPKWVVCHYDTNFQLLKMRSVPFETRANVCMTASDERFFYAILQSDVATKTNISNTYILCYNAETKKIDIFSFYQEKGRITALAHYGNMFVYSVYYANKSEERVYVFNTQSLTQTVLHEDKTNICVFQDAYTDTLSGSLWLVSKCYESKKQTSIHLTQLDSNGVVLQSFPLVCDSKYTLKSCKIISSADNAMLLSGNFINNDEQRQATKNNNSGIFTTILKNNQIEELHFFEYTSFENWYTIQRRNISNSYDISYFVAQSDSLLILATDFYAPEYQQSYADQYAGAGFYAPVAESKLVGYRYQTACIYAFDKKGKLLWYSPFNYSGLLLKSERTLLNGYIDTETNEILYLFDYNNKIFSLVYKQMEVVQGIKAINVLSASRYENITATERQLCQYWYGNNFVYSAYQFTSKKYNSKSRKSGKYVFGINKLSYK